MYLKTLSLNPYTIRLSGSFVVTLIPLYVICWISESLKKEIDKISKVAYELPWYLCSVPLQKTLRMIMLRASKPIGVTMGKFYIVSLQSYQAVSLKTNIDIVFKLYVSFLLYLLLQILRTALSYMALLRTFFQK